MGTDAAGLGYIKRDTPVHRLSGAAKLLMTVLVSIAAMITYDTRFLLAIILLSFFMFFLSKIKLREIRLVLVLIAAFMLLNNVIIFLFAPEEGVAIYGTRHVLAHLAGPYYLTQEQLFYQLNVTIKYFSILPIALIFIYTTQPSEFAASLNKIGVHYKVAYSVALALRYIPDVQRDFREIRQAQQARGIDMSRNVKLSRRLKSVSSILFPLIFTSIDKIETVSNAMELRSFGKEKNRTWYCAKPFSVADVALVALSALLVACAVWLNFVNHGRFYNPFL